MRLNYDNKNSGFFCLLIMIKDICAWLCQTKQNKNKKKAL